MNNFRVKTLVTLLAIAGLGGCAATQEANHSIKDGLDASKGGIEKFSPKSTVAIADPTQSDAMANFGHVQKNWVNPNPLPRASIDKDKARLPVLFQKPVSLTMPGKVSLVEVLSELQRVNGIRFDLSQDIYSTNLNQATVITGNSSTSSQANTAGPVYVNDFVFRGTLQDALDLLAAKANISWKWNGAGVDVFKYETRSYNITLLAGTTTSNSEVSLQSDTSADTSQTSSSSGSTTGPTATNNSGQGGAGSTNNTSTQGVKRTATLDSWTDVKQYLLSLMSPDGTLAVMESSGLVTVKDTPDAQRRVAKAVADLNNLVGKQIYMNVNVYSVTMDSSDDYGLDLNAKWAGHYLTLGASTGSGSSGTNGFSAGIATGPFASSSVFVHALSSLGKTSIVNQFSITTLNGQPTPIGNNKKIPYISGIQIQSDANGNPLQSIITGAVYQGIGMSITPKVQPNGKVLVEYALNLNDFNGFSQFSTGSGATAQSLSLPNTTLKNILQRASLRSGQTLVLSGFKQANATSTDQGIGSVKNWLLGGGNQSSNTVQYLVITVTPYVAKDDTNTDGVTQ